MKTENVLNGIVSFIDYEIVSHPQIRQEDKAGIIAAFGLGLVNPARIIQDLSNSGALDGSLFWLNEDKTEINIEAVKNTAYKILDVFGGEYVLKDGIPFNVSFFSLSLLKGFTIQKSFLDKLFEHIEAI